MDRPKKLLVVRLRSSINGSYLVACPDKKTVAHVNLGSSGRGLTSIENALWVATPYPDSRNDGKHVCLTSVYGKLLGTASKGGDVLQMEAPRDVISRKDDSHTMRWKTEKMDKGANDVYVKACPDQKDGEELYLMALPDAKVLALAKLFWPFTWMLKGPSRWVLEVGETGSTVNFVEQARNHTVQVSGAPPVLVGQLVVNNPSIYSEGASRGGAGVGSSSYSSGGNSNCGSGTQISGDVNVRTEIGRQNYTVNFNL